MVFPREVLNRLRWTEGESLDEAVIWYIHRGAPGDNIRIHGTALRSLGRTFFETEEASIPYHRILRIDYRGETLFEKDARAKGLR
ncbi:MAG TPA: DUF504 domain-containing protein [Thermoplasmata archaeon]|nr:DUF504 domain-containing protein [Thermoplasmata archaeon]